MGQALKYYGSDEARYDLQKKEDDLRKTNTRGEQQASSNRTSSIYDNDSQRNSGNLYNDSVISEKRA